MVRRPIVEEYLRALPATGAAVTLVVRGEIMFSQGFGLSGRMDKVGSRFCSTPRPCSNPCTLRAFVSR